MKQMSSVGSVELFRVESPKGWVYPCTVDDIDEVLSLVDKADLVGLSKVGLVPSSRKDEAANARYFWRVEGCEIRIFSYRESLEFSYKTKLKLPQLQQWHCRELSYGMDLELAGDRVICRWVPDGLRRFVSRHVLLHEVGHHVYQMQRVAQGLGPDSGSISSEKSAERYALKMTETLFPHDACR